MHSEGLSQSVKELSKDQKQKALTVCRSGESVEKKRSKRLCYKKVCKI